MDAAIWIDPARMTGQACLSGTRIPCESLAAYVACHGVAETLVDYHLLGRHRDVLVAVAWWTLHTTGGRRWEVAMRKVWRDWAVVAWAEAWHAERPLDDPPEVDR